MRLAVLTDIHANREALTAVLDDISARQINRIAVLGDIVGYGPDPGWCTDRAAGLVAEGAICVKGNHDEALEVLDPAMKAMARDVILWTRGHLSPAQRGFLAGLPMQADLDDLRLVHASADNPGDWTYVSGHTRAVPSFLACAARLILCGHVHSPALYSRDLTGTVRNQAVVIGQPAPLLRSRRWLAVVGAVGQPRDGSPQAGYAVLDTDTNDLTFRRVPYDVAETVRKLRAAGLPKPLATRLMRGV